MWNRVCGAGGHEDAQHSALHTLLDGCRRDHQDHTLQDAKARGWNISNPAFSGLQYSEKKKKKTGSTSQPHTAKLCHVRGFLSIRGGLWDQRSKSCRRFSSPAVSLKKYCLNYPNKLPAPCWRQQAEKKMDTYVQKGCKKVPCSSLGKDKALRIWFIELN